MTEHISTFHDRSGIGSDFETSTVCGSSVVGELNGTPKCFSISLINGTENAVVMPKLQALTVAAQIASQFGFKLVQSELKEIVEIAG